MSEIDFESYFKNVINNILCNIIADDEWEKIINECLSMHIYESFETPTIDKYARIIYNKYKISNAIGRQIIINNTKIIALLYLSSNPHYNVGPFVREKYLKGVN